MKGEVKLEGLDGVLEMLSQLPAEVASKNGGPVRTALRKGAMVFVKQARLNYRAAVSAPGLTGITQSTGFSEKQIAARRRKPPSGIKGEKYIVTANYVLHPNETKFRGRPLRANDLVFLMEYGSSKQPAQPWLRPAFLTKAGEAMTTVERELLVSIERAVTKLANKNRGK